MKENWHIMHFRQTNPIFLSQINGGAKAMAGSVIDVVF
jgi:hypothetical protein